MDAIDSGDLRDLYQEVIFDHYRRPRHFGHLPHPDRVAQGYNPLCGDRVEIELALGDDGVIRDISFSGEGCAISTASASLLTEAVKGKRVDEALALFGQMHGALVEGRPLDPGSAGKLAALEGVKQFPARIKCALLAWHTLRNALNRNAQVANTDTEN
ncbi:Fe-S cluster assembly sulfur transfer protein SufU [Thiomonas bhubaneswarensis]|uniref:Fe-S cluster assembly protein SufU n=1 Tax=Thiomonas bhubaneswarensis TaxID=339866 RepID=A0A0K6I8M8_9BURK|nr:SUF system NifU family Fe-S cluster assembly protein [Thiomonas bhubaneswarensis]CUA99456.1 Fe-S cluster assembly protein SufU [Thiomonas bhubaneswarensis]